MAAPLKPAFAPEHYSLLRSHAVGKGMRAIWKNGSQKLITHEPDHLMSLVQAEYRVLALSRQTRRADITLEWIDHHRAYVNNDENMTRLVHTWRSINTVIAETQSFATKTGGPLKELAYRLAAFYAAFKPLMNNYGQDLTSTEPLFSPHVPIEAIAEDIRRHVQQGYKQYQAAMKDPERLRAIKRIKTNQRRNRHSLFRYVDALFHAHGPLYLIHLDLGYAPFAQQTAAQVTAQATYANLREDLRTLFYARKRDYMLKDDLVGHIWKIEDSPFRRFHAHLLLFYRNNADKSHQGDIAQQQEEMKALHNHWIHDITQGTGACYQRLSGTDTPVWVPEDTGYVIDSEDHDARRELTRYLDYLITIDQLIGLEAKPKMPVFSKGHMPRQPKTP